MKNIQIIGRGKYIPKTEINNKFLANKFDCDEERILELSGIEKRFFAQEETMEEMAYKASLNAIKNANLNKENIDMIIVATTSATKIMPGISFFLQKMLDIKKCMCLDVLGGCSGYINAFDIARNYIALNKVNTALIVGVESLSKIIDDKDFSTAILLGDGAGATIISKTNEKKIYTSNIRSQGQGSDLLTYEYGSKLNMQGKKIYKYAVKEVTEIIKETLKKVELDISGINTVVLHQSNQRIMDAISARLDCKNKFYTNIKKVGNTFCASIPIALSEINLQKGEKIMLVGYGGGLNSGCIILEY